MNYIFTSLVKSKLVKQDVSRSNVPQRWLSDSPTHLTRVSAARSSRSLLVKKPVDRCVNRSGLKSFLCVPFYYSFYCDLIEWRLSDKLLTSSLSLSLSPSRNRLNRVAGVFALIETAFANTSEYIFASWRIQFRQSAAPWSGLPKKPSASGRAGLADVIFRPVFIGYKLRQLSKGIFTFLNFGQFLFWAIFYF